VRLDGAYYSALQIYCKGGIDLKSVFQKKSYLIGFFRFSICLVRENWFNGK
jgi:hypothetical protein